ncbi:hypothetical protein GALMADRAFT_132613 [Galerina marginata CBS 339.88]|uniref:Uncharacterized protein n=1 Tax=Galerina marginata (strain CBS 339.88) TaxID=685588 RepID=A0A067U3K7_GALM3|nr:hypothetical protein GALMADRAFT_132613 [Galerina marginata CBS 339.88]
MELENGSAPHLTRDTRSSGSLPSSRAIIASPPAPTHSRRRTVRTRRKRSTELAVSAARDTSTEQENKRVTHHRTSSVETIRTRSSKPKKSTDVLGHETTHLSITCAGATKQKSKSFPPSSIILSGLRAIKSCTQESRKPRSEKTVKKPDSVPLSRSPPAILNVGHADVATGIATHTTAYLSIDVSDDLSRWDMDYIPTIPSLHSPPDSPGDNTHRPANSNQPPSNSNPFSTPIDDDALLENDIPFPLNRHSRVVLENMGVKKSKTLAQARSINAGGTLNRQALFPRIETPPTSCDQTQRGSTLPGLPHPLPLRTLCQNTDPVHPYGSSSPRVFIQPRRIPESKVSSGPSPSRRDAWGCFHLAAADLELSIVFPQTSHFEIWDMGDNAHIACPAMLCLMAKDAQAYAGKPLATPDVSLIDIRCEDLPLPSPMAKYNPKDEYATFYMGAKTGTATDDLISNPSPKSNVLGSESISLEGKWVRTYARPGVEGSEHSRVLRRGDMYQIPWEGTSATGARGWYLKFWVPIPTRLFEKRETRSFNIHARVWMMGDEQRALSLDENKDGKVFPLLTDSEMTVSHLRKEREMERWC